MTCGEVCAHACVSAVAFPGNPKAGSAAGAVSAAVRELRPLEIVGLYESQRENLEVNPPQTSLLPKHKAPSSVVH